MEGDVLLISQEIKDAAKRIFKMILEKEYGNREDLFGYAAEDIKQQNKTLIIAVSGESGAGKSEITHELSGLFRKNGVFAKCICTDNFYKIPPEDKDAWRKTHKDQIGINEYDWDLINKITDDFRKRQFSTFPIIDLNTQQVETLTTNFAKVNVIIIEGIFAIAPQLEDCDFRVFITASEEKKKNAQIVRGKENPNDPFREFVIAKEKIDVKKQLSDLENQEVLFLDTAGHLSWKTGNEVFNIIKIS